MYRGFKVECLALMHSWDVNLFSCCMDNHSIAHLGTKSTADKLCEDDAREVELPGL
jgi:hypothetical protein